ncbi:winged helix-turn-helix domain-containing protein [Salinarchaeum chitinilyticum]
MTGEEPASLTGDTEAVFSALGDETRLRILLELAERPEPDRSTEPYSFSELRRAVGVEDAGRFNYHLDELQDTFVTKSDAGYRPTLAGLNVASAIHAGRFASGEHELSAETAFDCSACAAPLRARYVDESVRLECANDHRWFSYPVPAGAAANRSMAELLDVTVRRTATNVELARTGLCPRCWGRTTVQVADPDGSFAELDEDWRRVDVECARCWLAYNVPLPLFVANSPPVVAFYHDHGLEPNAAMLSERTVLEEATTERVGTSPDRFEVTIELDDDRLALLVDREGTLLEYDPQESAAVEDSSG